MNDNNHRNTITLYPQPLSDRDDLLPILATEVEVAADGSATARYPEQPDERYDSVKAYRAAAGCSAVELLGREYDVDAIARLRADAAAHGDTEQVEVCRMADRGDLVANEECAEVILYARLEALCT